MKISYYNGEFKKDNEISVDYNDRAFYFGDGVYEVVRIYDGEFFTLDEHVDRLLRSAHEIELPPIDRAQIVDVITGLKERNDIDNGTVYIQVSRGIERRNHSFPKDVAPVILAYMNEADRPFTQAEKGADIITVDDYRWLKCHVKSLNLLANVMEKERAVKAGAHEAVMHRDGIVTEGSSTNVFIVKDGVLRTHPANHYILNGITRLEVLKIARELDTPMEEEPFTVDELKAADEVFITSTTQEITPVITIDGEAVGGGARGAVTLRLQEAFNQNISGLNLVK